MFLTLPTRALTGQHVISSGGWGGSLDDLAGAGEDRRGDCQPEPLGGLEVDHQLECRGLLDRQITRLSACKYSADIGRCPAISAYVLDP